CCDWVAVACFPSRAALGPGRCQTPIPGVGRTACAARGGLSHGRPDLYRRDVGVQHTYSWSGGLATGRAPCGQAGWEVIRSRRKLAELCISPGQTLLGQNVAVLQRHGGVLGGHERLGRDTPGAAPTTRTRHAPGGW